jgi:hypothetical protein
MTQTAIGVTAMIAKTTAKVRSTAFSFVTSLHAIAAPIEGI